LEVDGAWSRPRVLGTAHELLLRLRLTAGVDRLGTKDRKRGRDCQPGTVSQPLQVDGLVAHGIGNSNRADERADGGRRKEDVDATATARRDCAGAVGGVAEIVRRLNRIDRERCRSRIGHDRRLRLGCRRYQLSTEFEFGCAERNSRRNAGTRKRQALRP
jgi:hypothetical protein